MYYLYSISSYCTIELILQTMSSPEMSGNEDKDVSLLIADGCVDNRPRSQTPSLPSSEKASTQNSDHSLGLANSPSRSLPSSGNTSTQNSYHTPGLPHSPHSTQSLPSSQQMSSLHSSYSEDINLNVNDDFSRYTPDV